MSCGDGPNGEGKLNGGGPFEPAPGGLGPPERACNGNGWNKELLRFINNESWWGLSCGYGGGGPDEWCNGGPLSREKDNF